MICTNTLSRQEDISLSAAIIRLIYLPLYGQCGHRYVLYMPDALPNVWFTFLELAEQSTKKLAKNFIPIRTWTQFS